MTARNGTWHGSNWIRRDKRLAIYLRDGFRCAYCNRNLANAKAKMRTLDHIIPVTRGGDNDETNLCTACKRCNDSKGDKTAWEYLARNVKPGGNNDLYVKRRDRLLVLIATPINRTLAKAIINGTLDLSDVLKEQTK